MSNEPKACAHCGGGHVVEEWRRQDDRWRRWRVTCDRCGMRTDWHGTREAAIATWNTRADKFGADDDYERRMDELLCRLTNGKWSKSRSYSVDFMVSCVDEAYDEILDPPVERHYAPRNTRADDAPELPQDDACAILRRVAADKTAVSSDDLLRYAVGADMVPEALNKIADMIERDYVRRDSIADDAPEQPVDNQADSRERLEEDVASILRNAASHTSINTSIGDMLRYTVPGSGAAPWQTEEDACEALASIAEHQIAELTAERDELRAQLKHKQLVIDRQRDSFLKLERENRELQDVCGELERTVENMRGRE